jgi:metal-responsive CopG/Arc/MetJ family transcriptional regulator
MSQQKKKLVALTFKIHPDLLEEIDNLIDNIGYRSRGHVINRIVDDWLNRNPRKDKKKMATFSNAMDAVKQGNGIQRSSWNEPPR